METLTVAHVTGVLFSPQYHETPCQRQWQTVTSSFVGLGCAPDRRSSSSALLGRWFHVHALQSIVLVVFGVSAGWSWRWLVGGVAWFHHWELGVPSRLAMH